MSDKKQVHVPQELASGQYLGINAAGEQCILKFPAERNYLLLVDVITGEKFKVFLKAFKGMHRVALDADVAPLIKFPPAGTTTCKIDCAFGTINVTAIGRDAQAEFSVTTLKVKNEFKSKYETMKAEYDRQAAELETLRQAERNREQGKASRK